jgi:hypothetical protein
MFSVPTVATTLLPEADPVTPANPPVPPVKVNASEKGPVPVGLAKIAEASSKISPDNTPPFANVRLKLPLRKPRIVISHREV